MATKKIHAGVFISYSHKDKKWLDLLKTTLAPLIRNDHIDLWDDTRIRAGGDWKKEIESAIVRARVGILLVSPDFLASDFIADIEIPLMLKQQEAGLTILWIPIRDSLYKKTDLYRIQAAYDPSEPLAGLSQPERDRALVQIAERIAAAADLNVVANAFSIVDEFYPQLDAFLKGSPEPQREASFSVRAKQEGEMVVFNSPKQTYPLETILAEDMSRLDSGARKLIRAYERTMDEMFDRWVELKPKRVSRDPEIKEEAIEESDRLRRDLCRELRELLNFIESMGKRLYDHYSHIVYICGQERQ